MASRRHRSNQLASLGAALTFTFVAASISVAAPLSYGAGALIESAATLKLVEAVHGTHRTCLLGRVPRWGGVVRLHRHVGAAHVPVRC
jgi:hypothetical protein